MVDTGLIVCCMLCSFIQDAGQGAGGESVTIISKRAAWLY
jgi:hypothetical protein